MAVNQAAVSSADVVVLLLRRAGYRRNMSAEGMDWFPAVRKLVEANDDDRIRVAENLTIDDQGTVHCEEGGDMTGVYQLTRGGDRWCSF